MLKILYVSTMPLQYNFSANIRNIALIDGLIRNEIIVDLITPKPNKNYGLYDSSLNVVGIRNIYYPVKDLAGGKPQNVGKRSSIIGKIKGVCLKAFQFIVPWDARLLTVHYSNRIILKENYDIMITSSDPKSSHKFGKAIMENNKGRIKKWVQYWGDPFAIDINKTNIMPFAFIKQVEKSILKKADSIVYVSPFTLKKQTENFPAYAHKMHYYPLPILSGEIGKPDDSIDYQNLRLGYYGAYKKNDRDIYPLYKAIRHTRHSLEIAGTTDVHLEDTERIKVLPRISFGEVQTKENEKDVLVCICNKKGTQIPGKAYHYAMSNKYILLIIDGENADEIRESFKEYNRYVICENNETDIIEKLSMMQSYSDTRHTLQAFDSKEIALKIMQGNREGREYANIKD